MMISFAPDGDLGDFDFVLAACLDSLEHRITARACAVITAGAPSWTWP